MAISEENIRLANIFLELIDKSDLVTEERLAWVEFINSAKEATNGLTPEEKIQKLSENNLKLLGRILQDRLDSRESRKELRCQIDALSHITDDRFNMINNTITGNIETMNTKFTELTNSIQSTNDGTKEAFILLVNKVDELKNDLISNDKLTYELKGKTSKISEQPKSHFMVEFFKGVKSIEWSLTTIIGIISLLLVFRPEFGALLEKLVSSF